MPDVPSPAPATIAAAQSESRALVAVAPPAAGPTADVRRDTPFLAQLIATAAGHPQTRRRRRAEPTEALAAYRAAAALAPA